MSHQLYDQVEDKLEAEACSWVFQKANGQPRKMYHHLPTLLPNHLRVAIRFFTVNSYDLLQVSGHFGELTRTPFCPGLQAVGIIERAGKACRNRKKGDVVVIAPIRSSCGSCTGCEQGRNHLCLLKSLISDPNSIYFGTYSTHIQLTEDCVVSIPEGLTSYKVPAMITSGLTAYVPLVRFKGRPLECAIIGLGGLGHLALQIALKMGYNPTLFQDREEAFKVATDLGCKNIAKGSHRNQLTKFEGFFQLVLVTSFTNSALSSVYQRLCCAEGTIVYCGVPSSKEAFELDLEYLRFKGITVEGSFLGPTKLIPEMLSFFQEHKIEPMVQTCDFEDLPTVVKNGSKGKAPWVRTMVSVGRFGKESKLFSI